MLDFAYSPYREQRNQSKLMKDGIFATFGCLWGCVKRHMYFSAGYDYRSQGLPFAGSLKLLRLVTVKKKL